MASLPCVAQCTPARVHPGKPGREDPFLLPSVLWRAGSALVRCFQFQAASWKISACNAKPPLNPSSFSSCLSSPSWPGVQSPRLALQQGFSGCCEDTQLFPGLLLGDRCPRDPVLLCKFSQVILQLWSCLFVLTCRGQDVQVCHLPSVTIFHIPNSFATAFDPWLLP